MGNEPAMHRATDGTARSYTAARRRPVAGWLATRRPVADCRSCRSRTWRWAPAWSAELPRVASAPDPRSTEPASILRRRLERREADFLDLVQLGRVRESRRVPTTHLLRCGRLRVRGPGAPGHARRAWRAHSGSSTRCGVYLTIDELKGRHAIVRGSAADPDRPRGPVQSAARATPAVADQRKPRQPRSLDPRQSPGRSPTGRSTSRWSWTPHRASDWRLGCWGVPGGSALAHVLEYGAAGVEARRWFSLIDPGRPAFTPAIGGASTRSGWPRSSAASRGRCRPRST